MPKKTEEVGALPVDLFGPDTGMGFQHERRIVPIPTWKRIFTWGLPIGASEQPQKQQETRTAEGTCGDYITS